MGGEGGADDASCTAVTPVLDIRELSVAYGATEALRGLELRVAPGEAVGLCGPSGCGKSSVAYAALGILPGVGRIASGRIEIEGADVTRLSPRAWRRLRAARVALAAQEPGLALNPVRRVGSQIASVLRAHGWGRAAARRRAEEVLEEMGLPAAGRFARAFPHQLSGGQLQRVVLAQALACGPALLIADEPATGLDAVTRDQVLAVLRRRVQAGMALLLISHRAEVLEQSVTRLVRMGPRAGVEAGAPLGRETMRSISPRPNRQAPRPSRALLLRARGLAKSYRRGGRGITALAGVDVEIGQAETVVLMGPSGAGKSTLARCLSGLERPDGGEIWRAETVGPRGAQLIWQDAAGALNPRMRLGEIIAEPWRVGDREGRIPERKERERRAGELLAAAGLPADWVARRPAELSGGQKRRVGILRALAVNPKLLILDEALTSVEAELREDLVRWLEALQQARGIAYLFITHDAALADRLGGRRLRLAAGQLAAEVEPCPVR